MIGRNIARKVTRNLTHPIGLGWSLGAAVAYPDAVDFGALTLASAGGIQIASSGATITTGNGAGEFQISSGVLTKVADTTLASASYSLGLSDGRTVTVTRIANAYHVATEAQATTILSASDGGVLRSAGQVTDASVYFREGTYDGAAVSGASKHWIKWMTHGSNTGVITLRSDAGKKATTLFNLANDTQVTGTVDKMVVYQLTIFGAKSIIDTVGTDRSAVISFTGTIGDCEFSDCNVYGNLTDYDRTIYSPDYCGVFTLFGPSTGNVTGNLKFTGGTYHSAKRLFNFPKTSGSGKVTLDSVEAYDFSNDVSVYSNTRSLDVKDCFFHSPYCNSWTDLQTWNASTSYTLAQMVQHLGEKYRAAVATPAIGTAPASNPTDWTHITTYTHRDFMQWADGGGGAATGTNVNILRNVMYAKRLDGITVDIDNDGTMQGIFAADNDPWNYEGFNVKGNLLVLGATTHGVTGYAPTHWMVENNTVVGFPATATTSVPSINMNEAYNETGENPAITITSITYVGTTITVNHSGTNQMAVGASVYVSGTTATTNAPNGTYPVATAGAGTFTYTASAAPTGTIGYASAHFQCQEQGTTVRNTFASAIVAQNAHTSGNTRQNNYDASLSASASQLATEAIYATLFTGPTWDNFTTKQQIIDAYSIKADGPLDTAVPKIGSAGTGYVDFTAKTITPWVYGAPTIGAFTAATSSAINTLITHASAVTITGGTADQFIGIDYSTSPSTAEFSVNGGAWRKSSTKCQPGDTVNLRYTTDGTPDGATDVVTLKVGTATATWNSTKIVQAVQFDGTDNLVGTRGTITNSSAMTIAFRAQLGDSAADNGTAMTFLSPGTNHALSRRTSNVLRANYLPVGGTVQAKDTAATLLYAGGYTTVIMSVDLLTATLKIAIGDTVITHSAIAVGTDTPPHLDLSAITETFFSTLKGKAQFFFLDYYRYVNLSDAAVRARFTYDNMLNATTVPTGGTPYFVMIGDAATWNAGVPTAGSGPSKTMTNAVTDV